MRFEEAFESWTESRLTQEEAAQLLGVCARTFRRYIDRYEEAGLDGLIDKRMSQVSRRKAPVDEVLRLVDRYRNRHQGWNVTHFHTWYKRDGGQRSYTWVKNTLQAAGLVQSIAIQSAPCGPAGLFVLNAQSPFTSRHPPAVDDELYALYPTANYVTAKDAYLALMGDLVFSCSAEELARSAMTGAPSYLYEITRGFDTGGNAGRGATHAIDIVYLFGNFDSSGTVPDAQGLLIRDAMRAAWTGLAGDPTGVPPISSDGASAWPAYDPVTASYAEFGAVIAGQVNHREGRCADLRAVLQ